MQILHKRASARRARSRDVFSSPAPRRDAARPNFPNFPLIHKVAVYQSSGTCKISAAFQTPPAFFLASRDSSRPPRVRARAPRASRRSFKRNRVESRHTPTRERTNEPSRDANLRQDAHGQDDHARGRVLGHDRQRQGEDSRQGRCGKTDRMNRRRGLRRLRSGIAARSRARARTRGDARDAGTRIERDGRDEAVADGNEGGTRAVRGESRARGRRDETRRARAEGRGATRARGVGEGARAMKSDEK